MVNLFIEDYSSIHLLFSYGKLKPRTLASRAETKKYTASTFKDKNRAQKKEKHEKGKWQAVTIQHYTIFKKSISLNTGK